MLQKIFSWTIWIGLGALLVVPTVVANTLFFPFITGKAFMFRVVVEIIFAAWLGLTLLDHSYRPKRSWVLLAVVTFGIIVGLADAFGVNPLRSFWSNYERMEGFITILHLAALFFVAGSFIKKEKHWIIFWNSSLVVSIVLALKGFSQVGEGVGRIDATFGNSTYFAVYLLFHVFIALWLLYRNRTKKWLVVPYLIVLAVLLPAIYFTGTRGTVLGLLAALVVVSGLSLFFARAHPNIRRVSAGLLVLVVLLIVGFFFSRHTAFVQSSPLLSRIANISLQDDTTQSRLTLWTKIAYPAFKERPLLGWGQDNFIVVFGKYYDPVMWKQEPWFDRAHNIFVDWAISAGALGLLAYLFLFGGGLWMLWKTHLSIPEKTILSGLFTGYAVHNFFVFDNLVSYLFFILVLAWIHALYVHRDEATVHIDDTPKPDQTKQAIAAGLCVAAFGLVWILNVRGIAQAQTLIDAIRFERTQQDYVDSIIAYEGVLSGAWLGRYEAREQFALTLARFAALVPDDVHIPEAIDRAEAEFSNGIREDSQNTRPLSFLSYLYRALGKTDEAVATLEKALMFNDSRQIFLYDLAKLYEEQGKMDQTLATLEHAFMVDTTNQEALGLYTAALTRAGYTTKANELLEQYKNDDFQKIAEKYIENKQFPEAAQAYEELLATGDTDPGIYATLGLIYIELDQRQDAIRIFEELDRLYPDAYGAQVKETIQALKDGKKIQIK